MAKYIPSHGAWDGFSGVLLLCDVQVQVFEYKDVEGLFSK